MEKQEILKVFSSYLPYGVRVYDGARTYLVTAVFARTLKVELEISKATFKRKSLTRCKLLLKPMRALVGSECFREIENRARKEMSPGEWLDFNFNLNHRTRADFADTIAPRLPGWVLETLRRHHFDYADIVGLGFGLEIT